VAIARCRDYGASLRPALQKVFDQLGGLGKLVKGKTVTVKLNLTGDPDYRMGTVPAEDAQYVHPAVIGSVARLLSEAGATRVQIAEGCFSSAEPLGEFMYRVGWDVPSMVNAGPRVTLTNTNIRGQYKAYARFKTPKGFHIFPAIDLNMVYQECDVLVSLAKMKEHATAGVTLAMKNMFGATPLTIYGDSRGKDEPAPDTVQGGRGSVMHYGRWNPSASVPQPRPEAANKPDTWRIPRIVADIAAARPIHLSIVEGVVTMAGGEGPWIRGVFPLAPGLIVAGLNPVCTDAVCMAAMGFDPMAVRGTPPFERCDSTLELAEQLGAGTRDLKRIEVIGLPVKEAVVPFRRKA
jgi:uncharacterized protein (DUF362 family)